jgi:hypothetical protein
MPSSPQQISQLLVAWSNGDHAAIDQLMPLVYGELRRMARRYMAGQPQGHTLQTTALIHEAYMKLVGQEGKRWQNRAHFFGVAAQAMRHILVDYASPDSCGRLPDADCHSRRIHSSLAVTTDRVVTRPDPCCRRYTFTNF